MASTLLITGANGFIGSHTTLLFESLGHRVVPIDITPRSPDLSLLPITTPTHTLDVTDSTVFRDLCRRNNVTHIFHAAHPRRDEDPGVLNFCLQALRNLLEAAKEMKIERVIFASSGALYGQLKKKDHSAIKEDEPVAVYPTYLYRAAKILGEWLGDFYAQNHSVSFVALRFSSVYGPGLGRGIPLAIKEGMMGRPCRPYLTRIPDDLIFVQDVAQAVRSVCFTERPVSRAYNIASGKPYWEKDLEQAMRKHLPDVPFEIEKHPNAAIIGPHRDRDILDVTLAREQLQFVPEFDLDRGIAAIADWVRDNLKSLS